ncbi:uncharacterized protein LOC134447024, partial [Engraulis encrasicolus]|uniref:uncharacterized protein LOC134447024 n=1 Tax=Engraulis encrasicolus TaxID=184585 RepID=UPI002FD6A43C
MALHSYNWSSSIGLPNPPPASSLSSLSCLLLSAPCPHRPSYWATSTSTWITAIALLRPTFCHFWTVCNITQHVQGPTHNKGHTLDLVCSIGTPPLHLECTDLAISDHRTILFTVNVPYRRQHCSRTITFRNIKNVSLPLLSQTLETHLVAPDSASSVDTLVEHYNTALATSLDVVAPITTRSVSFSQPAPWFTSELRLMKQAGRQLERRHKKTGLTVHLEAYRDHVRSYKQALSTAKTQYFSTLINNQQNHPRMLFSTINRLLRPPQTPQPSDAAELCSSFQDFFTRKVDTIHQQLLAPPQHHEDEPPDTHQPWQDIAIPAA